MNSFQNRTPGKKQITPGKPLEYFWNLILTEL